MLQACVRDLESRLQAETAKVDALETRAVEAEAQSRRVGTNSGSTSEVAEKLERRIGELEVRGAEAAGARRCVRGRQACTDFLRPNREGIVSEWRWSFCILQACGGPVRGPGDSACGGRGGIAGIGGLGMREGRGSTSGPARQGCSGGIAGRSPAGRGAGRGGSHLTDRQISLA